MKLDDAVLSSWSEQLTSSPLCFLFSLFVCFFSPAHCIWGGPKSLQPQTQKVTTDFWPVHGPGTHGHLFQSHHWSQLQVRSQSGFCFQVLGSSFSILKTSTNSTPHCCSVGVLPIVLLPDCYLPLRTLRETQPWTSPQVSERYLSAHQYPTVGQISPRTRKSMSLDMGQPSQANTKKLLGLIFIPFLHLYLKPVSLPLKSECICCHSRYQEELRSSHIRFQSTKETWNGGRHDHPSEDEACSWEWLRDRWECAELSSWLRWLSLITEILT